MKFTTPIILCGALALSACVAGGDANRAAPGTTAPVGPDAGPCPQGQDQAPSGVCVSEDDE